MAQERRSELTRIAKLSTQEKANSELDDDYSPPSVKNYLPRVEDYDQLVPSGRGGNVNATITI